ncbi:MAG: SBBP repeat-containing protein, partial [Nitrospirota bacterium]
MALGVVVLVAGSVLISDDSPPTSDRNQSQNASDIPAAQARNLLGKISLQFIKNQGQLDPRVAYYARGGGSATYFTPDGVYFSVRTDEQPRAAGVGAEREAIRRDALKLVPLNANTRPRIVAENRQTGTVNHFAGKDSTAWKTKIPTYGAVVYEEIYPGIDLKFYGASRHMEYDLLVEPGADPSKIRFAFEGIRGYRVTEQGALEVALRQGAIVQQPPIAYQEINGQRVHVPARFQLAETADSDATRVTYGFQLASYDATHPLVIDPVLTYATYLGGLGADTGFSIALDPAGDIYVAMSTDSVSFPTTTGAFDETYNGGTDVVVAKLDAASGALVYATYLGGSGDEPLGVSTSVLVSTALAVDALGNAYVGGVTSSPNLPTTPGSWDPSYNDGDDAFVAKLDASGGSLVYATYLGGSAHEAGRSIAIDGAGSVYVTGGTESSDFPTTLGAFDTTFNGGLGATDAYVAKLSADGSQLVYSTFLGGVDADDGFAVAVDAAGNAYITGETTGPGFPTTAGAFDQSFNGGGIDAFVAKLNASGTALVYSTLLGGNSFDASNPTNAIAIDSQGQAYVTGCTSSSDFPTTLGAYDQTLSTGCDVFVTKVAANGTSLVYSTFIGGNGYDDAWGITLDAQGRATVTGFTEATDYPTTFGALSSVFEGGTRDAFISTLDASGKYLLYSTFMGGSGDDIGFGVTLGARGAIHVIGDTSSVDLPTTAGALSPTYNGGAADAFVVKLESGTLVNLSTRGPVLTSPNVMYGGFILRGDSPKQVLIRGRGPSMSGAPFNVPGTLANPKIDVYSGQTVIARNDNWQTTDPLCLSPATACGNTSEIIATGRDPCQPNPGQTVAPPGCANEAAVLITLPPGPYSVIMSGVNGGTGVGLFGVTEMDASGVTKLVNVSTRGV